MKRLSLLVALMTLMLVAVPAFSQSLANLIESGNRKAALEQIRTGANVNEAQPDGTRPIHWAIQKVDYEILSALLTKKATVNVRNEFGATPISMAAELGDAKMVK